MLSAVVGYSLPSVRDEPRRLPAAGYHALTFAGVALATACVVLIGPTLEGFAAAIFCLALVIITAADLECRLIPNRVVVPASVVVVALMTAAHPGPEWALAALGAGFGMFVVAFVYPAGMGMGDVKLAVLMGAALGRGVVVALMLGMVLAAIPAIGLLVRHGKAGRTMAIPFGPFLALGSLVVLFAGS